MTPLPNSFPERVRRSGVGVFAGGGWVDGGGVRQHNVPQRHVFILDLVDGGV